MFRKLSAMAIVAVMLFVSVSMVSFNVNAENVPGPFADRSNGYPIDELDLNLEIHSSQATVSDTIWESQTFKPNINGKLTRLSVTLMKNTALADIYCGIYTVVGGDPASEITSEILSDVAVPAIADWINISFSSPPTLVAGTQYAIVLYTLSGTATLWKRDASNDFYVDGEAQTSNDGGNIWNPINYDFTLRTYMSNEDSGLKKVAWHPDGKYALAVAGDDTIYRYDREITTWSIEGTPNADYVFNDIVWDDFYSEFYLVGQNVAMGRAGAYKYDGTIFTDLGTTPSATIFYSVDVCGGYGDYNFLAVGEDSGGYGYAAWHHDVSGWIEVTSGWTPSFPEQLHDVAWNQRDTAATYHYAVGVNDESDGFIYRFQTGSTVATMLYEQSIWNNELEPGYAISWNPLYSMGVNYDYALIGTEQYYGYGNCYKFDGMTAPKLISKATYPIYDIGWHPEGELAVLVGGNPGDGKVYHHNRGIDALVDMTSLIPGSPDIFYGVAVKGPSSPSSAIIIGSSGSIGNYVDASDTGTQITVNAAFPQLYWIGFNDSAGTSRMDQQVAVDSWYNFTCGFNYSQGFSNCEVEIWAWYDWGALGTGSNYPVEADDTRDLAFRLLYDVTGATYTIQYPGATPGTMEIAINDAWDTDVIDWVHPTNSPLEDIHTLTIPIYLGPQIRNATGNGFGSGDDLDANGETDKNQGLQDTWSWDFEVEVRDVLNPTALANRSAEFGIDETVSISVTGNPSGNTPPGTNNNSLTTPSLITYSANTNYWVNVSIPDLLENGVGPAQIDCEEVTVANVNSIVNNQYSDLNWPGGRAIAGPDVDWCVWGNRSILAPTNMPAPSNGTISFGEFGSDFNQYDGNVAATTQLNWWISVPGSTSEGVYWAIITMTIDS